MKLYPHRYKQGKLIQEITAEQFETAVTHEYNRPEHRAFLVLLYYTGVRVSEALRATKETFQLYDDKVLWDVGKRLKHGKKTPPLPLSRNLPHVSLLVGQIEKTKKAKLVFNFDRTTAWRHASKTGFGYNHHARLSAITFFLKSGYSVAEVVNWFGISVQTVNSYIGEVTLDKMGSMRR